MPSGVPAFFRSFRYAGQGIVAALREQQNLRIHLVMTIVALVASVVLRITFVEWLFIVLAIGFVWVTELLNSAVELLGDAISREQNPLIGKAKDIGAGAVLIASLAAATLGTLIFGRHILLLWA